MKSKHPTDIEAMRGSFDIRALASATAGASVRTLLFEHFPLGAKYRLPLIVGDFRLARMAAGDIGLTIGEALLAHPDPLVPDRGAQIDLALVVHMGGKKMADASLLVWAASVTDKHYLDAYIDYHDGTHEYIDLWSLRRPEARVAELYELPSRPIIAIWLVAPSDILLLNVQCSVAADA